MTLSEIIITASITALVIGPGSWLHGYRTAMYDSPRTTVIQVQWPEAKIDDVKEATGSARRVKQ